MKLCLSALLLLTLLAFNFESVSSARILAIIPIPSYSHQIAYRQIWQRLGEHGHDVVVITTNPVADPKIMSYKEVSIQNLYKALTQDFVQLRYNYTWIETVYYSIWDAGYAMAEMVLENQEVQKLYEPNSGEKFDVVLAELLLVPSIYTLAHRFNAPLIGLASLSIYNYNYYIQGAPVLPSHPSTWEMESRTGLNLSFWNRVMNFCTMWKYVYWTLNEYMVKHQRIAEKYFGKDIPDLRELEANMSLILMYHRDLISFTRPTLPNIIHIGGIHVTKKPAPLPKEMEDFLSNAPEGFIYVSLGTNAKLTSLSDNLSMVLYKVLSKLPCKVMWKFSGHIPNMPANLYVSKWFPQESVLSHPKIRAFVYQGGLQSTEEAVAAAVPLVGLPVLADQDAQVHKMVQLGVARKLDTIKLTVEDLDEAIRDVLTNKRYKEAMLALRNLSNDKPYDLLNHAVWWIEYVARHRGAPHLKCSIAHDPWYQRNDMDVVVFLSLLAFVIITGSLAAAYMCLAGPRRLYKSSDTRKKEKIK